MTEKVGVTFEFPGVEEGERAVKVLGKLVDGLTAAKGAGKSLEELRKLMEFAKGKGGAFDELSRSIKKLDSTLDKLPQTISKSMDALGRTLKHELKEIKQIMATNGVAAGQAFAQGISQADGEVTKGFRSLAAKARTEATRAYEAIVKSNANLKLDGGMLGQVFDLKEAGARLSPYHAKMVKMWEDNGRDTYQAIKKSNDLNSRELKAFERGLAEHNSRVYKAVQERIAAREKELQVERTFQTAQERLRIAELSSLQSSIDKHNKLVFKAVQERIAAREKELQVERTFQSALSAVRAKEEQDALKQAQSRLKLAEAERKLVMDQIALQAKAQTARATANASGSFSNLSTGKVSIDFDEGIKKGGIFSGVLKRMTGDMNDAHSAARGLAAGLNALFLTWGNIGPLLAGAALSFGTKAVVQKGAEVQNTMETIRILSQESAADVAKLNDQLLEMGRSGPFGPLEIAKAMKILSLAGLEASQVGTAVRDVLNFAVGGDTSIEKAADVLTSVATAFSISAEGYNRVADVIAKTAAISKSSVDSIGEAFKTASVINKQYGVSLEDVGASLALLSNLGIQGTAAGTALRNMYVDLSGRTPKVSKALKALGVELRDNNGDFKDLVTVIGELDKGLSKLKNGKLEKDAISVITSERGGKLLIEALDKFRQKALDTRTDVQNVLAQMKQDILDAAGFVVIAAAQMSLTPLNQMKSVAATLETTIVETFRGMEPTILAVSSKLKETFNSTEFKNAISNIVVVVGNLTQALVENLDVITKLAAAYLAFKIAMGVGGIFGSLAGGAKGLAGELKVVSTEMKTVAAASSVATLGGAVAGFSRLAMFLGPIGGLLAGVATAWQLYDLFASKANKTNEDIANSSYAKAYVQRLQEETARLNENTEALRQNITVKELRDRDESRRINAATEDQGIKRVTEAQKKLQTAKRELENIDKFRGGLSSNDMRLAPYQTKVKQAQAELENTQNQLEITRKDIKYAEIFARAAAQRNADALAESQKKPDRKGGSSGFDKDKFDDNSKETLKKLGVFEDSYMQEIEKRFNRELALESAMYGDRKKLVDAKHKADIISEGQYQAQVYALAGENEQRQLDLIEKFSEQYSAAYAKRKADLTASLGKATESHNIEAITAKLAALDETYKTFTDTLSNDKAKAASAAQLRINLALIEYEGQLNKATLKEQEFWAKQYDETEKLKAAYAMEQAYKSINESVFSFDAATKAAMQTASAESEKLDSHLRELQRKLYEAEKAAIDFGEAYAEALANGSPWAEDELSELQKRVDKFKDLRAKAEENAVKTIADRADLAFEKVRQQQIDKFNNELADALETAIFEGGKAGGKKFIEVLKNELLRKPFRVVLQGMMNSIGGSISGGVMNLLGLGGSSGAAGGSGVMGMFNPLLSAYNNYGSAAGMLGISGAASSASALGMGSAVGSTAGSTMAASSGLAGAGGSIAAAAPYAMFILAAIKMIQMSRGETRSGGQYGYSIGGVGVSNRNGRQYSGLSDGAFFLEGPSGGDPYQEQATGAINATVSGINSLFENLGVDTRITNFNAGYESSSAGKGGVFSGGTLTGGVSFGESGKGSNYGVLNPLFETTSSRSPGIQEAFTNFGTDLLQVSIQALQAASGILSPNQKTQKKSLGFGSVWSSKAYGGDAEGGGYQDVEQFGELVYAARTAAQQAAIEAASGIPKVIRDMIRDIEPESLTTEAAGKLNEAITKIVTDVASLSSSLKTLGIDTLSTTSFDAKHAIIQFSGSIETLTANLGSYYENFYSDDERRTQTIKNLTKSFGDLSLPMIDMSLSSEDARRAFRELVESQDLSTEAGQKAFAGLMGLAGAFAEVTPLAGDLGDALSKFSEASDKSLSALKASIDAEKERIQTTLESHRTTLSVLQSVFDVLKNNIDELENSVNSVQQMRANEGMSFIDNAIANGGINLESSALGDAISAARTRLDPSNFSNASDFGYATGELVNKLKLLSGLTETQITYEETVIKDLEQQLAALDLMYVTAENSLNELRGIKTTLDSIDVAFNAFYSALASEKEAPAEAAANAAAKAAAADSAAKAAAEAAKITAAANAAAAAAASAAAAATAAALPKPRQSKGWFNIPILGSDNSESGQIQYETREVFDDEFSALISRFPTLFSQSIPGYAEGGMHSGGLAITGERGWEIGAYGPSRFWNQRQIGAALGTQEDNQSSKDERREQAMQDQYLMAKNNQLLQRQLDIIEKWDNEGMPAVRT